VDPLSTTFVLLEPDYMQWRYEAANRGNQHLALGTWHLAFGPSTVAPVHGKGHTDSVKRADKKLTPQ